MDKRELLKSVITNMINGEQEPAAADLHTYFTAKMREVSGIVAATDAKPVDTTAIVADQDVQGNE